MRMLEEIRDFVYIPEKKNHSYGGSQQWFPKEGTNRKDQVLHRFGCGLVSLCDVLLTISMNNQKNRTEETVGIIDEKGLILRHWYLGFLKKIEEEYAPVHWGLGLNGKKMAKAFNAYAVSHRLSLRAKWGVHLKQVIPTTQQMLKSQIPVILSIGPDCWLAGSRRGVALYQRKNESFVKACVTSDHYVTVTGLVEEDGQFYFQISSWGRKYYINCREYMTYVREQPPVINQIFSSILAIEEITLEESK